MNKRGVEIIRNNKQRQGQGQERQVLGYNNLDFVDVIYKSENLKNKHYAKNKENYSLQYNMIAEGLRVEMDMSSGVIYILTMTGEGEKIKHCLLRTILMMSVPDIEYSWNEDVVNGLTFIVNI